MKRLIVVLALVACGGVPRAVEPPVVDRFDVVVSFTSTFESFDCTFVFTATASDPTRAVIYELTVNGKSWDSGHFFHSYESTWRQSQGTGAGVAYTFSSGAWSKTSGLSASCP